MPWSLRSFNAWAYLTFSLLTSGSWGKRSWEASVFDSTKLSGTFSCSSSTTLNSRQGTLAGRVEPGHHWSSATLEVPHRFDWPWLAIGLRSWSWKVNAASNPVTRSRKGHWVDTPTGSGLSWDSRQMCLLCYQVEGSCCWSKSCNGKCIRPWCSLLLNLLRTPFRLCFSE